MKRILVTAELPGEGFTKMVSESGFEFRILNSGERSSIKKAVIDFQPHGLVTLLSDTVDRELIDNCPELEAVSNYAAGYNNIDAAYCTEKGIAVTNTPDVLTDATADIAMMLILMASRRACESERFTRKGFFKGWKPDLFLGKSLAGKKLGILGLGRIGCATALRAKASGMDIIYWSSRKAPENIEDMLNAKFYGFDELIKSSDVISLHLPYVPALHHLIGEKEIAMMKSSVVIVNTARGQLIDENALADALTEKRVFAAGFDVYEKEPLINEKLYGLENTVLLPHIGSATEETRAEMAVMALSDCMAVLNGKKPLNKVN